MQIPPDKWNEYRAETTAPALEILEQVYRKLLDAPELVLKDGAKARIAAYDEPAITPDGEIQCGFDALFPDDSHLEFTVRNTGWGKSFVNAVQAPRPGRGR